MDNRTCADPPVSASVLARLSTAAAHALARAVEAVPQVHTASQNGSNTGMDPRTPIAHRAYPNAVSVVRQAHTVHPGPNPDLGKHGAWAGRRRDLVT